MIKELLSFITNKLPWGSFIRGLIEGRIVDFHERYVVIANILKDFERITRNRWKYILDAGSHGCSPLTLMGFNVCSLDIRPIRGVNIVGSVTHLPFRDQIFDVITMVDVIEHIPPGERERALSEAKRVSRRLVLIHVPLNEEPTFRSRYYELLLYIFLKKKKIPEWEEGLREHLKYNQPTLRFFLQEGFKLVKPDWNIGVWYTFMKLGVPSKGLLNRFIFLIYYLILRFIKRPPYWGGFLVYKSNLCYN